MKWSWRIGRVNGVDIYIHATFLLLLAYAAIVFWNQDQSLSATLIGLVFVMAVFGCVLLHELGHALAAQRFGIVTRDITLLPIGGLARLERMPDKPLQELWVAIAGPLVNVVIALGLAIGLTITRRWAPLTEMTIPGGSFVHNLLVINVVLVVFNLIPAFPMDGGRVLRAILAMTMDYTVATQIAAMIGQAIALIFVFVGILLPAPMLVFIALFVWIGAGQEASMIQMKTALSGIPVRRAMLTDFRIVSPEDSLSMVSALVLEGWQTDFPVVDRGELVGILTRRDLLSALARQGSEALVGDVMQREFETVEPGEMLELAFARLQSCACHTLPVVHNTQLVGLITADNVGEFLMLQAALARRR
jgi:Zn-dependent protease/CBS domain-containing protein